MDTVSMLSITSKEAHAGKENAHTCTRDAIAIQILLCAQKAEMVVTFAVRHEPDSLLCTFFSQHNI
jgi:hypothetical protein